MLDGENLRLGISRDLGFSSVERSENLRRGAEVARLANQAGLLCVCSFLAPSAEVRERVREMHRRRAATSRSTSPRRSRSAARARRELYARAEAGEIPQLPGVSAPYDVPTSPDLVLPTHEIDVETCVDRVVQLLERKNRI